jgi:hypothetical protein
MSHANIGFGRTEPYISLTVPVDLGATTVEALGLTRARVPCLSVTMSLDIESSARAVSLCLHPFHVLNRPCLVSRYLAILSAALACLCECAKLNSKRHALMHRCVGSRGVLSSVGEPSS